MKIQNRKHTILLVAPLTLAVYSGTTGIAEAQRQQPSRDERREQRREEIERMTPEQRQQYFRTRREERLRNMTPEQRQQWEQRRQEWQRRQAEGGGQGGWGGPGGQGGWGAPGEQGGWGAPDQQENVDVMANAGITDDTVKDAIRAFVAAQQEARKPLLEMARQITLELGKADMTNEQIAARLKEFRTATAVDQKRYETALQELDTKIGYTKNARLETFLMMAGILGYEAPQVGGSVAIFANLTPTAAPAGAEQAAAPAAPANQ